jgi:2-keto-4-pentenoate hydratase/2-oxohepta-3-ene-1,7-dioic acid hydratase in catechol pathway
MNQFQFETIQGDKIELPPGKIVCVGRNYVEHIKELENEIPTESVFFLKPKTAFQNLTQGIKIPTDKGAVHHEIELAILIAKPLSAANESEVISAIGGYALALDLTLRELQSELKKKGLPWERAKAFDGSCPITAFKMAPGECLPHQFELKINAQIRQHTSTEKMITPIPKLLSEISHWFSLEPGDVVLTGTPAGVAELQINDQLEMTLDNQYSWTTTIYAK